ncbi:MAG: VanZ family protein, partial [Candidatus Margulisiibacteriota bacterium]
YFIYVFNIRFLIFGTIMRLLKFFLYWIPVIIYLIIIFFLSSRPAPEVIKQAPVFFSIKPVHLIEYGFMCLLFVFALFKTYLEWHNVGHDRDRTLQDIPWRPILLLAISLTIFAGIADEVHQSFVPSRTGTFIDVITDTIAAVTTAGVVFIAAQNKSNK